MTTRFSLMFLAVAALSACSAPPEAPTMTAAVSDPYRVGPGGVATYQGDVNRPGVHLPGTPAPQPAAPDAPAPMVETGARSTVAFERDRATLSPDSREALARQADYLLANEGTTALVEGHADEDGTRDYNLALGARRASAVQEYLVLRGVEQARIRTISYGRERPVEVCTTETCRAQNRRAVTTVSGGAGV
ncbi:MAG: OmpA family protein [Paracoccus sp. (in: a-proteobacteria)]|nr:OmpA family protein [Paracoccus sp. (in: a-proteobacteria)]